MKKKNIHNINETGYKTPESYFDSIEDRILDKLKNNKPLEEDQDAGYTIPDSYFESIEDRVFDRLSEDHGLNDIVTTGFKTPDGYFVSIEDKVLTKLNEDRVTKVIPLISRRNILYLSGVAAAVLIMFGIFNNTQSDFDSLDLEVVESYLEQQDLNTYEIASVLTEDDLSQDEFRTINENFSEESLEDYLIDNANLEDILEQ